MKQKLLQYLSDNVGNLKSIKDKEIVIYLNSIFPHVNYKSNNYSLKVKSMMVMLDLTVEPTCLTCGRPVSLVPGKYKFSPEERQSEFFSWKPYCCQRCAHNSKVVVDKRRATNLERFGETSWAKSKEGKTELSKPWDQNKKDKFNASYIKNSLEKYGVEHYSKTAEYLKTRDTTNISRYGVKNTFELIDKIKETNNERYGYDYYQQSPEGRAKLSLNNSMKNADIAQKSRLSRMINGIKDDVVRECLIENNREKLKNYIDSLELRNRYEIANRLQISHSYLNAILRKFDMRELYLSPYSSNAEIELYNFIKTIYSGKVILNDRTILSGGRELDLYIPDINLAIEYNGVLWHSEGFAGKDALYHLGKTEECESRGIQLLHIFDTEWNNNIKKEIWKSIIRNKLKSSTNRYYARKCTVKNIPVSIAREFLDVNHLNGFIGANTHLGMYYEEVLVSVLSYGKSRFEDKQEVIRYASLLNSNVVGGFGKFFKHLPADITTYADRRYSSIVNSVYGKFFSSKSVTTPNWYGFDKTFELKSRWSFQKSILSQDERYVDGSSVIDNLINCGYDRIWDCGNLKFTNKK